MLIGAKTKGKTLWLPACAYGCCTSAEQDGQGIGVLGSEVGLCCARGIIAFKLIGSYSLHCFFAETRSEIPITKQTV